MSIQRKDTHFLLILNDHGSHLTPEFNQLCMENNIVSLYMLSHLSHLLQSLNVSVFAVLKHLYEDLIEQQMCLGFNTIQKADFLNVYFTARKKIFTSQNIQSSFIATGISLYNFDQIIQKLDIQLCTSILSES